MTGSDYVELQVFSNFTFLEGASHAQELAIQAKAYGMDALAITDRNSVSGLVRAHKALKDVDIRLIVGCCVTLDNGLEFLVYPKNRDAYGRLCRLLTLGRRRVEKGQCQIFIEDLVAWGEDMIIIAPCPLDGPSPLFLDHLHSLSAPFKGRLYLALSCHLTGIDGEKKHAISHLSQTLALPLVVTNAVLMHSPSRKALCDILCCIRHGTTIDHVGRKILPNAEQYLKSADDMHALFSDCPEALGNSRIIAEQCQFSLEELAYQYPDEILEDGKNALESLEYHVKQGARTRYHRHIPPKVQRMIDHEMGLVKSLNYAPYFLTVYDLVRFARNRGILCQGRGSAANSILCYCLGITAIDPVQMDLLFERFISAARDEPPDIDVDFEHNRREEVIQYVYEKYGRHRAGMTATVITYRARGAIRDVGKAMGLSEDRLTLLSSQIFGWSKSDSIDDEKLRNAGLDPKDRRLRQTINLIEQIMGFPRHLSQHVGGFVITDDRLDELVPVENAAMEDRTVIQWDKDDLDTLGILKVDLLSLGMLSCLRKSFDLLREHYGRSMELHRIPANDTATYDMLGKADTIGVFQVESRAQMAFLPRMKPRTFYDLVIEVAIIRPGPIQGDMIHPYIRRRNGEEEIDYPSGDLKQVLKKTLGVPLFQEQAMKIAIVAAGFSPSEADELRRAMATFRNTGTIAKFQDKFTQGMIKNGYDAEFAERCFKQIEGFGEYGFPESHAASFALLAYASSWLKCHYPDIFACALLNSQPMGFYAPAQIVRDAENHGVKILPVDVNHSNWDCTLEANVPYRSLRLGLRMIKGLREDDAEKIALFRGNGYRAPEDLWQRAGLDRRIMNCLARADAMSSLETDRREAFWTIRGIGGDKPLPLFAYARENEFGEEPKVTLPAMSEGEHVVADFRATGLSLRRHPMALLRDHFPTPIRLLSEMKQEQDGTLFEVAGIVLVRQRPGSAKGVIFVTLEDESDTLNLILWQDIFKKYRKEILTGRLLSVKGRLQRQELVTHLIVGHVEDRSDLLVDLSLPDDLKGEYRKDPSRIIAPSGAHRHPRNSARRLFPSRDFH